MKLQEAVLLAKTVEVRPEQAGQSNQQVGIAVPEPRLDSKTNTSKGA